jgi:hypothetical protein
LGTPDGRHAGANGAGFCLFVRCPILGIAGISWDFMAVKKSAQILPRHAVAADQRY